ncbi:kinase-like protein [Rhizopogon salebrosus TDB-379]|nr:kinase-like protein [Rhizopogon salebrosus TDB-379]KAJ8579892.1 kinase-like protein [Rhizopogon salebrosus TDB-379]
MMFLSFFSICRSWLQKVRPSTDNHLPDLTRHLEPRVLSYPIVQGSFGDVWKCIYVASGRLEVAVKSMRIDIADNVSKDTITQILLRDYHARKQLQHENILPLLGFSYEFGPLPAMVSPWMHNGSLSTYLDKKFTELTWERKLRILQQVATAIRYLHSKDVVHGDLTANNILIDIACNAHVADHGILAMCSELGGTPYIRRNVRLTAPEFFEVPENEDSSRPKAETDIYSFGCIMLQVMTGRIPYADIPSNHQVTVSILTGRRPGRPSSPHIEDSFWDFIQECWSDLGDRPSAVEVLSFLQSHVRA